MRTVDIFVSVFYCFRTVLGIIPKIFLQIKCLNYSNKCYIGSDIFRFYALVPTRISRPTLILNITTLELVITKNKAYSIIRVASATFTKERSATILRE